MRRNRPVLWGCLLFALAMAGPAEAETEVLCQEPTDAEAVECSYLLLAGITEEPDPINMASVGSPGEKIPADIAFEDASVLFVSGNGMTVAVWSDTLAGNSDIVFSQWHPGGWQHQALTFGGSDEQDPRADIAADGAIYVTWWETEEPRRIRVARRDPVTLEWEQPEAFAAMYGGRPSVLALDDEVLVAFERSDWSGGQQVVVRRVHRSGVAGRAGGVVDRVLARTRREAPLAIELHLRSDRVFIDWIHRTNYFGYSEYQNGQWGASVDSRPLSQRVGFAQVLRNPMPVAQ